MKMSISRRQFLAAAASSPLVLGSACQSVAKPRSGARAARFVFTSAGKTVMMNADGSGLHAFEFDVPNQVTWQTGGFFSDGRRLLFLSMEPRRDGPGKPFDEYYHQTPTHIWIHDLDTGSLTEVATRDRLAPFYTPQLLVGDDRVLMQVVRNKVGQVFSMNLDGSDAREFTRAGEGMPYGFSLSPDRKRVAYHLATSQGYQIWTCDVDGANRTRVAGHPDHLYFGPCWSPDGQWLAFHDCLHRQDPGHDWSDLCVSRPDGSETRLLTEGQSLWFAATYGDAQVRGRGSNMLDWTHDGAVLVSQRLPGSRVAWEYQAQRPDTDHFNRDYKPESARGGTEIRRIHPRDGMAVRLTHSEPPVWDFRQAASPDGQWVVFCRAETGGIPALWIADGKGRHPRLLTKGLDDRGAEYPRWFPM